MPGFLRNMVKQRGQFLEDRKGPVTVLSDAAQTLTADRLASGFISCTPTAGRNFTLDTAANLLASSVFSEMDIGDCYEFTVASQAAFALTVVVAAGITNAGGAANLVCAANASRRFILCKTSATAMTILGL